MNLTRLAELTASHLKEAAAAPKGSKRNLVLDMEGLARVVEECFDDLSEKIGRDPSAVKVRSTPDTFEKYTGLTKIIVSNDAAFKATKDFRRELSILTEEYLKKARKLMSEIEGDVQFHAEATPNKVMEDLIFEGVSDYSDLSEFTEEFYGMKQQIAKFQGQMKNPRWMKYMKATDRNSGIDSAAPARGALAAIVSLDANFTEIANELDMVEAD